MDLGNNTGWVFQDSLWVNAPWVDSTWTIPRTIRSMKINANVLNAGWMLAASNTGEFIGEQTFIIDNGDASLYNDSWSQWYELPDKGSFLSYRLYLNQAHIKIYEITMTEDLYIQDMSSVILDEWIPFSGQFDTLEETQTFIRLYKVGSDSIVSFDKIALYKDVPIMWVWGNNEYGQLGNNTRNSYNSPVSVVTDYMRLTMAERFSIGTDVDGFAWGSGNNEKHELGNVSGRSERSPVSVLGGISFNCIRTGYNLDNVFHVGLDINGKAWSWGSNYGGQLGDNTTTDRHSPVLVVGDISFVDIACGPSCVVGINGANNSLWSWGLSAFNQLGAGDILSSSSPISVPCAGDFVKVSIGYNFALALDSNKDCWSWGLDSHGQLGNTDIIGSSVTSPVIIPDTDFVDISCGKHHSISLDSAGKVWAWGDNSCGQLGSGDLETRSRPNMAAAYTSFTTVKTDLSLDSSHAVDSNGKLWSWGDSNNILALPVPLDVSGSPSGTKFLRKIPEEVIGHVSFIDLALCVTNACGVRVSDKSLWTWGDSALINGTSFRYSPKYAYKFRNSYSMREQAISIFANGNSSGLFHYYDEPWVWGSNAYGMLGTGSTVSKNSPVSVMTTNTGNYYGNKYIEACFGKENSYFIRYDNMLFSCGRNNYGQLGDNSIVNQSIPVSVLGNIKFISISSGLDYAIGIDPDGIAWAWGSNSYGQLGTGDMTNYSSPMSVAGGIPFQKIVCGSYSSIGLDASGVPWVWGRNNYGQLGTGDIASYSSPVLVIGGLSFNDVATCLNHSLAIDNSGKLWAWGRNNFGQLGDGTTNDSSSPVSVIGEMTFLAMSVSGTSSYGISNSNGQLWSWGDNSFGQLGNLTTASESSPVAVIGGVSFNGLTCGTSFVIGSSGNGVWAWGDNTFGQLGISNRINKSSPVSVLGGVKTWLQ